jgi:ferrous iron transport protein A
MPEPSAADFPVSLSALRQGDIGEVTDVVEDGQSLGDAEGSTLARRLGELGFVPGASVQVVAVMWLGGDPMVVRVGGSTFALRGREAQAVRVVQRARSGAAP